MLQDSELDARLARIDKATKSSDKHLAKIFTSELPRLTKDYDTIIDKIRAVNIPPGSPRPNRQNTNSSMHSSAHSMRSTPNSTAQSGTVGGAPANPPKPLGAAGQGKGTPSNKNREKVMGISTAAGKSHPKSPPKKQWD